MWEGFSFLEINKDKDLCAGSSYKLNYLDDKIFNEYSSLFFLRRKMMEEGSAGDTLTLCQHRRFVLNKRMGRQSQNQSWVWVLSPVEVEGLDLHKEVLPLAGRSYLIGSAFDLPKGIMIQYAQAHFLRDILRFTSTLVDAEILTDQDALLFLTQTQLVPSPSCGSFRLACFLEVFAKLELAANAFWNSGYKAYRDSYQSRVCGFLLERLNSFLLLKYLHEQGENIKQSTGSTTVVSDSLVIGHGLIPKS